MSVLFVKIVLCIYSS